MFCEVLTGRRPGHLVVDEPGVAAFLDARPVFKGHVLVVPRQHAATLAEVTDGQAADLFGAARRVALALERALPCDGAFVAVNNRVSQSVAHVHVHVVPRRFKDGLRGFFWPRQRYDSDAEAADYAERVRAALAASALL